MGLPETPLPWRATISFVVCIRIGINNYLFKIFMIYVMLHFQLETLEGTTEDLTKRLAEAPHLESLPQQVTDLKQVSVILLKGTVHQLNDKGSWKNVKWCSILCKKNALKGQNQNVTEM